MKRILLSIAGSAFALALTIAGMAVYGTSPHAYFAWDGIPGFYAAFGLLAPVGIVLIARIWGGVVTRRETYWEEKK